MLVAGLGGELFRSGIVGRIRQLGRLGEPVRHLIRPNPPYRSRAGGKRTRQAQSPTELIWFSVPTRLLRKVCTTPFPKWQLCEWLCRSHDAASGAFRRSVQNIWGYSPITRMPMPALAVCRLPARRDWLPSDFQAPCQVEVHQAAGVQ